MSIAGNTAPIAVTFAGVGVDSMVEEDGIVPVSRRLLRRPLQIAMNAIFNYVLENLDDGRLICRPQNAEG